MTTSDRSSKVGDSEPPPALSQEEEALLEARNTLQQYDRLVKQIRAALDGARGLRLRPSLLSDLNRAAVEGLVKAPGALRTKPIEILGSKHQPPAWTDVAAYVDDLCEYVNDNANMPPVHLSAYVMWRVNWIHPFAEGNGRTSRAASYFVLCVGLGYLLPGPHPIPDRIAANKRPYYRALEVADAAWLDGNRLDLSAMEDLLSELLQQQLADVHEKALGRVPIPPEPAGKAWETG